MDVDIEKKSVSFFKKILLFTRASYYLTYLHILEYTGAVITVLQCLIFFKKFSKPQLRRRKFHFKLKLEIVRVSKLYV